MSAGDAPRASARRPARRRASRRRAPVTANGRRLPIGPTRSTCSRARRRIASPSSSPCVTAACSSPRSPSTAAPRRSWPPTWRRRRARGSGFRRAETRTSRTSAAMRRPIVAWSSTSTTSTRPSPVHGSGTSSGSPPASRSRAGTAASPAPGGARSCSPSSRPIARTCVASPSSAISTSGTGAWTCRSSASTSRPISAARSSSGSTATSPRPVARIGCARLRSSPSGSTASCGSEAIRPCSSRWRRCSRARSWRRP